MSMCACISDQGCKCHCVECQLIEMFHPTSQSTFTQTQRKKKKKYRGEQRDQTLPFYQYTVFTTHGP